MNDFVDRKRTATVGGVRPIYGYNDTFWEPCSHPARLTNLLSQFPNFNTLSVVYCSEFIFPECNFTDLDVTQISATISSNSNRSEPLSTFISSTPNAANQADFKRILMALVLPQQVQVIMEFDRKKNVVLNGVIGLMAKIIFSTTPFFRNITLESARSVDAIIGAMLISHEEGALPLTVAGKANSVVWELLATNVESGDGWVNHASNGVYHIGLPLYDGIAELLCYARQNIERNLEIINVADELIAPPIYVAINNCLQNVYAIGGEARKIANLIRYFRDQYQQFLISLNKLIADYGETGVRLNDDQRRDLERLVGEADVHLDILNSPVRYTISSDSLGKFFLMLPQAFTANERIYRQPVAEAACSAEMQRVIYIFRMLHMWCQRDRWGARLSVRQLFVLTVESIKSNHVAKRILKWCLKNGDIRVNPLTFLNANLP